MSLLASDSPPTNNSPVISTSPLDNLLMILRRRKADESMASVANRRNIGFMANLLNGSDYMTIPSKINHTEDAMNLLDFTLYLLSNNRLYAKTLQDGNRRVRRLILKLGAGVNIIPQTVVIEKEEVSVTDLDRPAGYGGFASVYEGSYHGNRVAIKKLRRSFQGVTKASIGEALIWGTLSHGHILPFIGAYLDMGICLVSPFMENGTLRDWRHDKNPSVAQVETSANFFLDSNFQVKIADFGLSRDSEATATTDGAMSTCFAAPELFLSDDEDKIKRTGKSDIYAFGCLHYEIHFDSRPFTCWDQDPGRRPSIDEVVETMSSWLSGQ